jgi:hypothetical protein
MIPPCRTTTLWESTFYFERLATSFSVATSATCHVKSIWSADTILPV